MTVDADAPALTGGLKTIYGMLVELRDGRIAERTADEKFMTTFRDSCDTTITEYTGKISDLAARISTDTTTSAGEAVKIEDEGTKKASATGEKKTVEDAYASLKTAHEQ